MNIFPFDFKKLIIVIVLVAIPLVAINVKRKEEQLAWFLKPVFITSSFLQNIFTNFSLGVRDTTSLYLNLVDIRKDNRLLKEKLNELEANLSQFKEIKSENDRLTSLLEFKKESPHTLLTARVIGHDILGQHSTLFIDKGSDDGVVPGQAVITPVGVVGSVLNTEKDFSQILTLTDRYSDIDAVIDRSRSRGILEGVSPSVCRLKYLQRTDDVQVGDIVLTTGLDHIFPKGFPIGKVTRVDKKDYGITQEVQVEPLVSTFDSEAVFVVIKANDKVEVQEKIKEMSIKD
ncbi:MAG: rod shape-determining protein MreC [Bdellovibrionota bacterium]